jgi:hypothetical protein
MELCVRRARLPVLKKPKSIKKGRIFGWNVAIGSLGYLDVPNRATSRFSPGLSFGPESHG